MDKLIKEGKTLVQNLL